MRRQTISYNLGNSHYMQFMRDGRVITDITMQREARTEFIRSDVKVNPKIDGFRKPSSYSAVTQPWVDYRMPAKSTALQLITDYNERFNGYWMESMSGSVVGYCSPDLPNLASHNRINKLRTKILNNIKDEVFDVAMVLAELQSTVDTCTSAMSRIGYSLNAVLKKDKRVFEYLWTGKMPTGKDGRVVTGRHLDRFNRQVSSMYLEWKYGVMPSVLDFKGACKALDINEKDGLFNNPPLLVARAVEKDEHAGSTSVQYAIEAGGSEVHGELAWKGQSTLKARCDFRVRGDGLRGLSRYGLGLGTIPTVMWDKTPFSFVFDMVVPVASMLKAWTALSGCEVLGYCETLHQKWEVLPGTCRGTRLNSVYTCEGGDGIHMDRRAYDTVPMPLPFVQNPIKSGNAMTVLSLFTQLRGKAYNGDPKTKGKQK